MMQSTTSAKRVIDEVTRDAKYWMDSNGEKTDVGASHIDYAQEVTKIRLPKSNIERGWWAQQGKIYAAMFTKGWVRISLQGDTLYCHYTRLNRRQVEVLEMWCIEDDLRAVNDDGRELMDYRHGPAMESLPGLGSHVSRAVLGLN